MHLPEPFSSWEPGDVFAACIQLGIIAANPGTPAGGPRLHQLTNGDFSSFDAAELVAGYRLIADWPSSLAVLLGEISSRAPPGPVGWRSALGQFAKFFHNAAPDTPLRRLILTEIPPLVRQLAIPLRKIASSRILGCDRGNTISARDAVDNFRIDNRVLARLNEQSGPFLSRHEYIYGTKIFDTNKLKDVVDLYKQAVRPTAVFRQLGVPAYCVSALARGGLLEPIANQSVVLMLGSTDGVTRTSVESLAHALDGVTKASRPGAMPLIQAMAGRLDPAAWVRVLSSIIVGGIHAHIGAPAARTCVERLWVIRREVLGASGIESGDLTGIRVPRKTAAYIAGTTWIVMDALVREGMIAGATSEHDFEVPLDGLGAFRQQYMLVTDVRSELGLPVRRARSLLEGKGCSPALTIRGHHLWLRSAVVAVASRLR